MNGEQRTAAVTTGRQQVQRRRSRKIAFEELVDDISPAKTPAAWRWTYDLPVDPARRGR